MPYKPIRKTQLSWHDTIPYKIHPFADRYEITYTALNSSLIEYINTSPAFDLDRIKTTTYTIQRDPSTMNTLGLSVVLIHKLQQGSIHLPWV
jgi:hypothetical protein